ncbi:MAG: hypothetical protein ACO1Q7_03985 [Gemmatimonas sp.]
MSAPNTPALPAPLRDAVLYTSIQGETYTFYRDAADKLIAHSCDDLPEDSNIPEGVFVTFAGTVHHNTQDLSEEECDARGIPHSASHYSEWWEGAFRNATDAEIAAVFCSTALAAVETQRAGDESATYPEANTDMTLGEAIKHCEEFSANTLTEFDEIRVLIAHAKATTQLAALRQDAESPALSDAQCDDIAKAVELVLTTEPPPITDAERAAYRALMRKSIREACL